MATRSLDRDSTQPLWRQLRDELLRRLEVGEFADRFPGELALVEEYRVSRHTVRQALQQLRADGVILAERGRQPRVAPSREIQQPMGALYSLFSSVESTGLDQHSVVNTVEVRADALVAERLDLEASTPLFYLERVRLAGDSPLALDRVWLPQAIAAPLTDADFSHTSLYSELSARAGVRLDHGREEIQAVTPTPSEQAQLHAPPGIACFAIHRLSHSGGRPVEWRHTLVRGDRFSLTADISADGYQLRSTGPRQP